MEISFDPAKRAKVLAERGLDLIDAPTVFESRSITIEDDRHAYGEVRWITYGWIDDVAIAVVVDRAGWRLPGDLHATDAQMGDRACRTGLTPTTPPS